MVRLFATYVVYHSPGQQRAHLDFMSVKSTLVARTTSKCHEPQGDNEPARHANAASPKAPPTTPHARDDRGIPTRARRPRHPRTAWNGESSRDARATAPAPAQDKSRPRLHALHQRPTQPRWQKPTDVSCRRPPMRNECGIYSTNAVFLTEPSFRAHFRTANIGAYLPFSSTGALNEVAAPSLEHPPPCGLCKKRMKCGPFAFSCRTRLRPAISMVRCTTV